MGRHTGGVTPTSMRLLSLLSLLQGPREWTGAQLAERLQVSPRTVRSDIERLRESGYVVHATRGGVGGYRLGSGGSSPPPLLLDAQEAVAAAVGLRTGVNCIIGGMEEASLQALAKLEQLLPDRLRHQVRNIGHYTVPLPHTQPAPIIDPALLTLLAGLCRGRERLRFAYLDSADDPEAATSHDVEPYRLTNRGHRWYPLGFDTDHDDWHIYAVVRIRPRTPPTGPRFTERPLPADDLTAYISRRLPETTWRHQATITVHAPAGDIEERIASAEGDVIPIDDQTCTALIGGETLTAIAAVLARLDVDFTVEQSPELAHHLATLADRYARSIGQVARPAGDVAETQQRGTRSMETEYVFSTGSDPGRQQVDCLADMLDGVTAGVLGDVDVQPGWRCLELGAGNGSIARWLAQRVGPTGTVTAVDLDTRYLDPGPNVAAHRHDVNDGLPPGGPFDLIHARLLLMHLSRRQEILDALVDALAPGGWLVIGDLSDRLPSAVSATDRADEKLFERVVDIGMNRVARPAGMNLEWGHDVGRRMSRAGLEDIHGLEHAFTAAGGTPGLMYYRSMMMQVEKPLLNAGLTEPELRRFQELMIDPSFSAWSYQFVFTRGRRPTTT